MSLNKLRRLYICLDDTQVSGDYEANLVTFRLIYFNDTSNRQELFYASRSGNCIFIYKYSYGIRIIFKSMFDPYRLI